MGNNPVNYIDPTGHQAIAPVSSAEGVGAEGASEAPIDYYHCVIDYTNGQSTGVGCDVLFPGQFVPNVEPMTQEEAIAQYSLLVAMDPSTIARGAMIGATMMVNGVKWVWQGAAYHHANSSGGQSGGKSIAPTNPMMALQYSIQLSPTSNRRIGVDPSTGQIVVLDASTRMEGEQAVLDWHGHVRAFDDLDTRDRSALIKAGLVDSKGHVIRK